MSLKGQLRTVYTQYVHNEKRVTTIDMFSGFIKEHADCLPTTKENLGVIMNTCFTSTISAYKNLAYSLFLSSNFQKAHPMIIEGGGGSITKTKLNEINVHVEDFIKINYGEWINRACSLTYRADGFSFLKSSSDQDAIDYRRCLSKFIHQNGFLTTVLNEIVIADILSDAYGFGYQVFKSSCIDDFFHGFDIVVLNKMKKEAIIVDLMIGRDKNIIKGKSKNIKDIHSTLGLSELSAYTEQQGLNMRDINVIPKVLPLAEDLFYNELIPTYIGHKLEGTKSGRGYGRFYDRLFDRGFPIPS